MVELNHSLIYSCNCPPPSHAGGKRSDSEGGSDREVQRTMLELLNQLDGFSSNNKIKVIAATNRPDILDPALLR